MQDYGIFVALAGMVHRSSIFQHGKVGNASSALGGTGDGRF